MTESIFSEINRLTAKRGRIIAAIDGRCASGKSELAKKLGSLLGCSLIHTDDFFLRPEQRTPQRYAKPGDNMDRERFCSEVLIPLSMGTPFRYRPFDCKTMSLRPPVFVPSSAVTVVEGTYSCHPELAEFYDLRIFLTTDPDTQRRRIIERNPQNADSFFALWIPLEEKYFAACKTEALCDLRFET